MKSTLARRPRLSRDQRVLVVSIPVSFQQRGGRKQIVVPPGAAEWQSQAAHCNNTLIKAVANAHSWRHLIEEGKYESAAELSKKLKVNESYMCRVLRLTLLSPDIVEAILNGRQPKSLELKALLKPFPSSWGDQRKHFSFA
jgi:hypothetical protein